MCLNNAKIPSKLGAFGQQNYYVCLTKHTSLLQMLLYS